MRDDRDEDWGEAPHGDVIARLLAQRYPILPTERLTVDVLEAERGLKLVLFDRRHRYTIGVKYQAGLRGREGWMLLADALDALFGTFMESGRQHRDLPAGVDVEYEGALLQVDVERDLPEVTKLANQLLEQDS
ncbi:MAG: hypothetical protein KC933_19500 [Myxococcales bacterium]|nr:hypothetical protein [Myxococcales bacterium]